MSAAAEAHSEAAPALSAPSIDSTAVDKAVYTACRALQREAKKAQKVETLRLIKRIKRDQASSAQDVAKTGSDSLPSDLKATKQMTIDMELAGSILHAKLVKSKLLPRAKNLTAAGPSDFGLRYPLWTILPRLNEQTRQLVKGPSDERLPAPAQRAREKVTTTSRVAKLCSEHVAKLAGLVRPEQSKPAKTELASRPPMSSVEPVQVSQRSADSNREDLFMEDQSEPTDGASIQDQVETAHGSSEIDQMSIGSGQDQEGIDGRRTTLPCMASGYISRPIRLGNHDNDSDWSDQDQELEDAEVEIDDRGRAQKKGLQRNNRRGQRARKAIWEKKYGKGAHHVQLSLKEQRLTEKLQQRREKFASGGNASVTHPVGQRAWGTAQKRADDARKRPTVAGGRGPVPNRGRRVKALPGADTAIPDKVVPDKESAAKGSDVMHPSWAARQAQKEKMSALAASGHGKKIVFD